MTLGRAPALFPLRLLRRPRGCCSKSRRKQFRAGRRDAVTTLTNRAIVSVNALHSDYMCGETLLPLDPSSTPVCNDSTSLPAIEPSPSSDSAQQDRATRFMYATCADFARRRTRAVGCDADQMPLPNSPDDAIFSYASAQAQAVPVIADRVALPTIGGAVELLDVLPADVAARYERLSPIVGDLAAAARQPSAMLCSPTEYVKLIRRLLVLGLAVLSKSVLIVNGMFCVPKDDGFLRLILDCRPANAVCARPPKLNLPTPDVFARLQLLSDRRTRAAHSDQDNAFWRYAVPECWRPLFGLPAVRAGDVGAGAEFGEDTMVFPMLTRLPMGWSHSPYLCQTAHETICIERAGLRREDQITATSDLRVDRPRWAVYLDDFTQLVPDPFDADALFDRYLEACRSCGLPPKQSKVTRPTDGPMITLGLELNCRNGTLAVPAPKLYALMLATEGLVQAGQCTGLELSRLLGKWTWACLVARPAFAVFNAVYRFVHKAGRRLFRLWPSVARELRVMVGLAPLLVARLDRPFVPMVVATDASEWGQGVVARAESDDVVQAAASLARVVPGAIDERIELELRRADVASASRWSRIISSKWRYRAHINALECRAVLSAVRWLVSRPLAVNSRVLALSDSAVCVAAVAKGRSSSMELLRPLRRLSAHLLSVGLDLHLRWVPTASNPADAASRRF